MWSASERLTLSQIPIHFPAVSLAQTVPVQLRPALGRLVTKHFTIGGEVDKIITTSSTTFLSFGGNRKKNERLFPTAGAVPQNGQHPEDEFRFRTNEVPAEQHLGMQTSPKPLHGTHGDRLDGRQTIVTPFDLELHSSASEMLNGCIHTHSMNSIGNNDCRHRLEQQKSSEERGIGLAKDGHRPGEAQTSDRSRQSAPFVMGSPDPPGETRLRRAAVQSRPGRAGLGRAEPSQTTVRPCLLDSSCTGPDVD
ncbi:unnamed protein product [Protopolystoma xenopodis]|uniref:Uncharacterized protein n=1 Tax=Protopolystoma xenopodis TaxID=117903 RepID=A0A3S5B049_9PLAT|nr:unnamed protein product [Protopolystoma xenopodis]